MSGLNKETRETAERLDRRHPCLHERRFDANVRKQSEITTIRTRLNFAALQAGMPAVQSEA